jgi:hypothetical protein
MPETASMLPNAGDELLHVPPAGVAVSVVVRPWQTRPVVVIAEGSGCTVTIAIAGQPKAVYVTVTGTGVTLPVDSAHKLPPPVIVATVEGVTLHVPPELAIVSVVHVPWHICVGPVIPAGIGLIVIILDVAQPAPPNAVYRIAAVPAALGEAQNTPEELIVPADVDNGCTDHAPPVVASVKVMH